MKLTVRQIKHHALRVFFFIELGVFAGIYVYGSYGIKTLYQLHAEAEAAQADVRALEAEVANLEHDLVAWNSHPFYKEKIAREKLQMARQGDMIYYVQ